MRDLDHKSENVQRIVKAYLDFLLNDLGYAGFRYDMVKGYSASFTQIYNESAKPKFSVGECWDSSNTIKNWIDGTGKTSAAFDFQFRYTVRNAANNGNWSRLAQQNDGNWPLVSNNYQSGDYRQWAVTFVENHDTEKRSNAAQDPIRKDTLAANAYLLAMPGTPCVFLTHWQAYKQAIKAMIDVRKAVGIHNESASLNTASAQTYYVVRTTGTNGNLLCVVGPEANTYTPNGQWVKVLAGYKYAYYLSPSMEIAWADLASGDYDEEQSILLTAVSQNANAQLVYTLDGSTPTANSTKVNSGTVITIPVGSTTLKVGLLIGNVVSGIITRQYNIQEKVPFDPYQINVYVNTDKVGWNKVNFWTWGGDGSHAPKNGNWPGDAVTNPITIDGKKWYRATYTINKADDFVNFVFSTNSGSPQTVDINNINQDTYFEISTAMDGGKYLVNDVTSQVSAINRVVNDTQTTGDMYNLQGQKVKDTQSLPHGIYIQNGKKIIVK
jgi:alpha-amylase